MVGIRFLIASVVYVVILIISLSVLSYKDIGYFSIAYIIDYLGWISKEGYIFNFIRQGSYIPILIYAFVFIVPLLSFIWIITSSKSENIEKGIITKPEYSTYFIGIVLLAINFASIILNGIENSLFISIIAVSYLALYIIPSYNKPAASPSRRQHLILKTIIIFMFIYIIAQILLSI